MIALSRRARRIVIANLAIATTFITGLVLWDPLGTYRCRSASQGTKDLRHRRTQRHATPRPSRLEYVPAAQRKITRSAQVGELIGTSRTPVRCSPRSPRAPRDYRGIAADVVEYLAQRHQV